MTEPEGPRPPPVDLSFGRMFCGIHGEPFREQWPRGAIIFQLKALEVIFASDAFWQELETRFGVKIGPDEPLPHEHVQAAFDITPICCRLGGEKLLETYEWQHANKGIGAKGFCCNPKCGRFALGAPFRQTLPEDGRVQRIPHICFRCVAMFVVPRMS